VLGTIIVVPCYNEAARLNSAAFEQFLACEAHGDVGFLFVDDGSRDATADVVHALNRAWPDRVRVLRLARNQGKAEAVRVGILEAARLEPELIGYWDADLATPLTEIPAMAARLRQHGAGLVIGSRIRMLGHDIRRSVFRHYLGRIFATFASLELRLPVYDTQCGAKIFHATPDAVALFARPFRLRWCFDVEVLGRFDALSRPVVCIEHPVQRWADVGASKLTAGQALRILPELVRLPFVIRDERRRR
jgi:glycosyltransferase involved in cell wall biosynthesis